MREVRYRALLVHISFHPFFIAGYFYPARPRRKKDIMYSDQNDTASLVKEPKATTTKKQ